MEPKFESLPRHHYKDVWSRLSHNLDLAKLYVIGDVTDEEIQAQANDTVKRLEKTIGIEPDDRILEIGCGLGRVAQALAPKCAHWTGLDVSRNMLDYAEKRLEHLPNVTLVEGNGYDLANFKDGAFNKVYCTVVFMHLDDWDRFRYTVEALRILAAGGAFFVDNVNILHPQGWDFFMQHCDIPIEERPPHMSRCSTPQELEVYFKQAGFTEIEQNSNRIWIETWGKKGDPSG